MKSLTNIIKTSLDAYYVSLKFVLGFLMFLMTIPVLMQILSRYSEIVPRYIWTEEAARFCFVWIVMIGSMIAVRDDSHFKVDLLSHPENDRQQGISQLIVHALMLLFAIVFAWYGCTFASFGLMQQSEMSGVNMLNIYLAFPVAGVTWAVFLLERIVGDVRLITGPDQKAET